MKRTFKAKPIAGKTALITYFSSFEEAEKFFKLRGEKIFDFRDTNMYISGVRYLAAVEYVE